MELQNGGEGGSENKFVMVWVCSWCGCVVVVFVVRISEHTETDQSTHTVTLIIPGDSLAMGRCFRISYFLFLIEHSDPHYMWI